jgi:serine/threonine-protein kinase
MVSPGTYQYPNARIDAVLHQSLSPWWKRLLAIIIDGFVIGIPVFIILGIIGASSHNNTSTTTNTQSGSAGVAFLGLFVIVLLATIPGVFYYGLMNGSKRGQTVGKMALGIAVRDARTGGPIGVGRGMGRFLIMQLFYVLLVIPYVIDNLSPLWDARRQAWHDKVVNSVVVETRI